MSNDSNQRKSPQLIRDMEEDLGRDVRKTARVVTDVIFGDFFGRHGFSRTHESSTPVAPAKTETNQAIIKAQNQGAIVLDAEVVDESSCRTCGGSKKLGAKGHEVPCPTCFCRTCSGRGILGQPGHEIPCPRCTHEP